MARNFQYDEVALVQTKVGKIKVMLVMMSIYLREYPTQRRNDFKCQRK